MSTEFDSFIITTIITIFIITYDLATTSNRSLGDDDALMELTDHDAESCRI